MAPPRGLDSAAAASGTAAPAAASISAQATAARARRVRAIAREDTTEVRGAARCCVRDCAPPTVLGADDTETLLSTTTLTPREASLPSILARLASRTAFPCSEVPALRGQGPQEIPVASKAVGSVLSLEF